MIHTHTDGGHFGFSGGNYFDIMKRAKKRHFQPHRHNERKLVLRKAKLFTKGFAQAGRGEPPLIVSALP